MFFYLIQDIFLNTYIVHGSSLNVGVETEENSVSTLPWETYRLLEY